MAVLELSAERRDWCNLERRTRGTLCLCLFLRLVRLLLCRVCPLLRVTGLAFRFLQALLSGRLKRVGTGRGWGLVSGNTIGRGNGGNGTLGQVVQQSEPGPGGREGRDERDGDEQPNESPPGQLGRERAVVSGGRR
jgi:hypothetical protein